MATRDDITLAITGASGVQYALRLGAELITTGATLHVLISKPARVVIGMETDFALPTRRADAERALSALFGAAENQLHVYGQEEWTSPVASGSGAPRRMVVCPASMATVSAIATGASRSLIERAADVVLKERGRLVVVPRETPLSLVHLRNLVTLAEAGAVVLPANPGFYNRPDSVEQIVEFVVARVMDQLGVDNELSPRWGEQSR